MNNKQITHDIVTNNILGSFLVVQLRESKKGIFDFLDMLRISAYHHIILKEDKLYTFPDIMEKSVSCDGNEYSLNNLDVICGEDADYWQVEKEIKRSGLTNEEVYKSFIEILENKSLALIYKNNIVYKKLCMYKIMVMKGECLPIYTMKVVHDRIKKFDLVFGDDILKEYKLKTTYIKQFKKQL